MRNAVADLLIMRGAFSDAECDALIDQAGEAGWETARTGEVIDTKVRAQIRQSDCARIYDGALAEKMAQLMRQANELTHHFRLDVFESLQVARYNVGDFFDWHIDMQSLGPRQRKLSATVLLSDPGQFEGGEFQFWQNEEPPPLTERGTFVVHPAWRPHRVTEVTKGLRYAATLWCLGPRFV